MVTSGFYKIAYEGKTGSGIGLMALLGGVVSGIDEAGIDYEGAYGEDADTGAVQFHLRANVPADVPLVLGVPAKPDSWSFAFDAVLPPGFSQGQRVTIRTTYGPVSVTFRLLRAL